MCSPLSLFRTFREPQSRELFVYDLRDCYVSAARYLFRSYCPQKQFHVFEVESRHPGCLAVSALHVYTVYAVYGGVSRVRGMSATVP